MIPVKDNHALYRDENSNAIISTDVSEHQKYIEELKESINLLNAHFIMSSTELEKHFPEVNNKVHIKPKLTLVKLSFPVGR